LIGFLDGEPGALIDLTERRPVIVISSEDRLDHREVPDNLPDLIRAELVDQLLVDPKSLGAEVVGRRLYAAAIIVAVVLHRRAS
jgi:hypothetical protein